MSQLKLLHVLFISLWTGLVLAEIVIEFSSHLREKWPHIAKIHYWVDLLFELPALLVIVGTGLILLTKVPILTPLFQIKIALGSIAILGNSICAVLVVLRHKNSDNPEKLKKYHLWIRWTGIAVPFGIAAAVIGFSSLLARIP